MSVEKNTNRLINEKSPYLLQHAHNPVNWYPWGKEAFENAKKEDKPIFLSIGYSTCHWCHVMEHESFEDEEVAVALNNNFIAIKVDREERPDIDAVYMSVCQSLTRGGGWPLTILMTAEQKPFYAGTYLPKTTRYGNIGILGLLSQISKQWNTNRKKLLQIGNEISSFISKQAEKEAVGAEPTINLIQQASDIYERNFDGESGGFGGAPKFPAAHNLLFLIRYSQLGKHPNALSMVEKTLQQMFRGGLFDHIGGGFSRYSTDNRWLIPHFEKMLYDNALLILAYLEAYKITKCELYKTVAERSIKYVLAELGGENGGFCCGQDADSEGVEGKYYALTPLEVKRVLGETDGSYFCDWFGITEAGNFEGKSIPNLLKNNDFNKSNQQIIDLCEKLYEYRLNRTELHLDDKILSSWNGLMIMALAKASRVLNDKKYLEFAEDTAQFILKNMCDKSGRLCVRWRDGEAANAGQLDDYAFYCLALLEIYHASLKVDYLKQAAAFANKMIEWFFDEKSGGFYLYATDSEQLISRPKEVYDGAMPSGNSAAAMVLVDLAALTGETSWQDYANKQLNFLAANIIDYPVGYSYALLAMTKVLYPSAELVCVSAESELPLALEHFLNEMPYQNINIILKTKQNEEQLCNIAPFTAEYPIPTAGTVYYLCRNGACEPPTDNIESVINKLV
ncbi:MAG: thioredoxin domain-containing protein [Oscillospiraceae bacterium]|nr:thioredoxin domain-containing protein [Oscillospiraceae bacterium]